MHPFGEFYGKGIPLGRRWTACNVTPQQHAGRVGTATHPCAQTITQGSKANSATQPLQPLWFHRTHRYLIPQHSTIV